MSLSSTNVNYYRKLSLWIIGVYVFAHFLIYFSEEDLGGSSNEWMNIGIRMFVGLLVLGVVIMSFINSVNIIRKTEYKKNFLWLIVSAIPFLFFLFSSIVVLTAGRLDSLNIFSN